MDQAEFEAVQAGALCVESVHSSDGQTLIVVFLNGEAVEVSPLPRGVVA